MNVLQEAIECLVLKRPELLDDQYKLAEAVREFLKSNTPRVQVDQALRELETLWRKDPEKKEFFSKLAIKWLVAWWKRYQDGKDEYPASNVLQRRSKNNLGVTLEWEIVQESRIQALGPWAKTLLRASQDSLKGKYQGPGTIRQLLEAGKIKGICSSGDIWWTSQVAIDDFLSEQSSPAHAPLQIKGAPREAPKQRECFGKRNKPATTCAKCPELSPCTATFKAVPPAPGGQVVESKMVEGVVITTKAPSKPEPVKLLPIPEGFVPKTDQEVILMLEQMLGMQKEMQASQARMEDTLKRIEARIEASLKEIQDDREVIQFIRLLRDNLRGV